MNTRAPLQIYTLSIVSKPLKMLLEKLCLNHRMEPRRVAHPIRAGDGGGFTYHKIINKSLNVKDFFGFISFIINKYQTTLTLDIQENNQCSSLEKENLFMRNSIISRSLPFYKSSISRRNYK